MIVHDPVTRRSESCHPCQNTPTNQQEEITMSFINYIKDCIRFAKWYPFRKGNNLKIWIRNVLYCNAQPRYWHGRLISKLL